MQTQGTFTQYEGLECWEKATFGDLCQRWAKEYGKQTALVCGEERISYQELEEQSTSLAYGFLEIGLKKGMYVAFQLANHNDMVIALMALLKIGAVPILFLPNHREQELLPICELVEPAMYLVEQEYQGFTYDSLIEKLKMACPSVQKIVVQGGDGRYPDLESLMKKSRGEKLPTVYPDDLAILLLSGGSTGVPKLIPRCHEDYVYINRICAKAANLNAKSRYLVGLPAEHNFSLGCPGIFGTLDCGGQVIFCEYPSPDEILELIEQEQVTITAIVPTMAAMCLELMEWDETYDVSSLQILQIGGALLEPSLACKVVERKFGALQQVYGTTEGLFMVTTPEDDMETITTTQGRPLGEQIDVRIVDENGNDMGIGESGELICKGPYTISGYYMAEEANKESFTADGFYRTGDKAMRLSNGTYRVLGRVKEQINRAGEKITPAEVEEFLCRDPRIKEAVVVGVPDAILGHRICAFVRPKETMVTLPQVKQHFQTLGVAAYKYPDQLEEILQWPMTKVGKIDRNALVKQAEGKTWITEN